MWKLILLYIRRRYICNIFLFLDKFSCINLIHWKLMIISLLIETKWNVKLWFAVDYYDFYINSGIEIFNTFYFNACLCKMSRMLLPRLIADQFDRDTRAPAVT